METLRTTLPLTPEEQTELEFEALLGAFGDRMEDTASSQEELRARDALIFTGLKETLQSAAALENISLLQNMSQRLAEIACNHDHFAQQLGAYDVFSNKPDNPAAHTHDFSKRTAKKGKEQDKKAKKKKKRPARSGWLRWLDKD